VRKITNEVPPHYYPQIQLSMEVLDLEICHFVQYRPFQSEFDPMQLECIVVHRDRSWFETHLPLMQKFISDLEKFKLEYELYIEQIVPKEEEKIKTKRKKNQLNGCLIEDDHKAKTHKICHVEV
jgi:hypothetical protein